MPEPEKKLDYYFNNLNLFTKILFFGILGSLIYFIYHIPFISYLIDAILLIIPFLVDATLYLTKPFIIVLLIFVLTLFLVENHHQRRIYWATIAIATIYMNHLGVFGEISFSISDFGNTLEYLKFSMKSYAIYLLVILLVIPREIWGWFNTIFLILANLITTILGHIPFIGDYVETIGQYIITFSSFIIILFTSISAVMLIIESKTVGFIQNRRLSKEAK